MKHPIILDGASFDWAAGEEHSKQVVSADGEVNWMAAAFADPGVMSCPRCQLHLWNEGDRVRCPECSHEWDTEDGVRRLKRERTEIQRDLAAAESRAQQLAEQLAASEARALPVEAVEALRAWMQCWGKGALVVLDVLRGHVSADFDDMGGPLLAPNPPQRAANLLAALAPAPEPAAVAEAKSGGAVKP